MVNKLKERVSFLVVTATARIRQAKVYYYQRENFRERRGNYYLGRIEIAFRQ